MAKKIYIFFSIFLFRNTRRGQFTLWCKSCWGEENWSTGSSEKFCSVSDEFSSLQLSLTVFWWFHWDVLMSFFSDDFCDEYHPLIIYNNLVLSALGHMEIVHCIFSWNARKDEDDDDNVNHNKLLYFAPYIFRQRNFHLKHQVDSTNNIGSYTIWVTGESPLCIKMYSCVSKVAI